MCCHWLSVRAWRSWQQTEIPPGGLLFQTVTVLYSVYFQKPPDLFLLARWCMVWIAKRLERTTFKLCIVLTANTELSLSVFHVWKTPYDNTEWYLSYCFNANCGFREFGTYLKKVAWIKIQQTSVIFQFHHHRQQPCPFTVAGKCLGQSESLKILLCAQRKEW